MNAKRVVILKSRLDHIGGLEKYTLKLAEAFRSRGCLVTLLTTGDVKPIDNIEVISLSPSSKASLFHLYAFEKKCQEFLKRHSFDIVFGMERTSNQTHYRAGSGVHGVYLKRRALTDSTFKQLSFGVNPLHRYILHLEKKGFENPRLEMLFTNSHMVRNEILEQYKTPPEKISVIHNGVEWHGWEDRFQKTFHIQHQGPFHFLFVGHGFKRKGLLFLLRGLESLKTRDFQLTVVGKDKDRRFFEKTAEQMNLKKHIQFVGPQKDITPFYQKADALVIPSIYDPFANVTVEALAMGLFVVSSKFNGGHEVLTKETGEIIEDLMSPESVKESLEKAFLHPKTKQSALHIRSSIKGLDFSHQLDKIVRQTCSI